MAGGAGNYDVGATYADPGAALAQLIADEDGTACTEDQYINIDANYGPYGDGTGTWIYPTEIEVASLPYRIFLKGVNGRPVLHDYFYCPGEAAGLTIDNIDGQTSTYFIYTAGLINLFKITNCYFSNTIPIRTNNYTYGTVIENCRFNCDRLGNNNRFNSYTLKNCWGYFSGRLFAENSNNITLINCRFLGETTKDRIYQTPFNQFYMYHSVLKGFKDLYFSAGYPYASNTAMMHIYNSIIDDFARLENVSDGNNLMNVTEGHFQNNIWSRHRLEGTSNYFINDLIYPMDSPLELNGLNDVCFDNIEADINYDSETYTDDDAFLRPVVGSPSINYGKPINFYLRDSQDTSRGQRPDAGDIQRTEYSTTPDFPDEGDVRNGSNYDDGFQTGNMTLPAAGDLRQGVQCGENGTEITGTLEVPRIQFNATSGKE